MTLSKILATLTVSALPLIVACSPPPVECNPKVTPTTCATGEKCVPDTSGMSGLGGYCEEDDQTITPPTTSCTSDNDCKRTETCDLGARVCKTTGVTDECKTAADCRDPGKPVCQILTSGNKCVAGTGKVPDGGMCTADTDCKDGSYCPMGTPRVCKPRPMTAGTFVKIRVEGPANTEAYIFHTDKDKDGKQIYTATFGPTTFILPLDFFQACGSDGIYGAARKDRSIDPLATWFCGGTSPSKTGLTYSLMLPGSTTWTAPAKLQQVSRADVCPGQPEAWNYFIPRDALGCP